MANRKVVCYIQYAIKLVVKSPLCVSGGADDVTDRDVQKDFDGNPFIPGTSLAGALRSYLEECADEKEVTDIETVFGYTRKVLPTEAEKEGLDTEKALGNSNESKGFMSRVKISDLFFSDEDARAEIVTRDGIKLENKLTQKGAKFDMEAIDPGAVCDGYLLLTIREGDARERYEALIERALSGLKTGEIRLGANKNRGFGEMDISVAKKKIFTAENIAEWLDFDRKAFLEEDGKENVLQIEASKESRYLTIRVPLRQKGGISIRRYSVLPGTPDYAHITADGSPVIPGSSWNGAIRSRVREFLDQLGIKSGEVCIDEWFGYVREKQNDAKQSNILISESVIEGGVDLAMSRTSINRYDASVVSGALYSEKAHFAGTVELEIKVRKNYYDENGRLQKNERLQYEPIVGMLLLAVMDIQNGYLAVGGQTAVGRGIFEAAGPVELSGTDKDADYYINQVSVLCAKEKNR